MTKIINAVLDHTLRLKWLKKHRTTVVGVLIALLGVYFASAEKVGLPPLDQATYAVVNGLLIERLAKFAKEHEQG